MPWHNLSDKARATILAVLEEKQATLPPTAENPFHEAYDKMLLAPASVDEIDLKFAEAAWDVIPGWGEPHEVEGMPGGVPYVSSSDDGAYVMAWIWVDNEEAGIEEVT